MHVLKKMHTCSKISPVDRSERLLSRRVIFVKMHSPAVQALQKQSLYRVAKAHKKPHLYGPLSGKDPYN